MIENNVLETMLDEGGKFDKRLADLYFCADSENARKLEIAFSSNFDRYKQICAIEGLKNEQN